MRDRLIELIESARYWGANTSVEIADHLLAEGVIVPPVKVGRWVWYVSKYAGCVMSIQVISYEITSCGISHFGCWGGDFTPTRFEEEAIGKTVFLTREEAEKALERSENGKS